MIVKKGGYNRYKCKKCRNFDERYWVWSWRCVRISKPGRKYRDEYERGDIGETPYHYDGSLPKQDTPTSKHVSALEAYKKPYWKLLPEEREDIDDTYNTEAIDIASLYRLGPAVPQPYTDVITGKDRYWMSLSESLNVDEVQPDCKRCGWGITYCEPHWEVTKEHYGNTTGGSNYYHTWCYKH